MQTNSSTLVCLSDEQLFVINSNVLKTIIGNGRFVKEGKTTSSDKSIVFGRFVRRVDEEILYCIPCEQNITPSQVDAHQNKNGCAFKTIDKRNAFILFDYLEGKGVSPEQMTKFLCELEGSDFITDSLVSSRVNKIIEMSGNVVDCTAEQHSSGPTKISSDNSSVMKKLPGYMTRLIASFFGNDISDITPDTRMGRIMMCALLESCTLQNVADLLSLSDGIVVDVSKGAKNLNQLIKKLLESPFLEGKSNFKNLNTQLSKRKDMGFGIPIKTLNTFVDLSKKDTLINQILGEPKTESRILYNKVYGTGFEIREFLVNLGPKVMRASGSAKYNLLIRTLCSSVWTTEQFMETGVTAAAFQNVGEGGGLLSLVTNLVDMGYAAECRESFEHAFKRSGR